MGRILTRELVEKAMDFLVPSIEAMLRVKKASWGPRDITIAVDGPGLGEPVCRRIGKPTAEKDWPTGSTGWGDYKHPSTFHTFALQKCRAARRNGEPTSVTIALRPLDFDDEEYLYAGGVAEKVGGLAVGASGLYGFVDEWVAWMIYRAVETLCQQEGAERIKEDNKKI